MEAKYLEKLQNVEAEAKNLGKLIEDAQDKLNEPVAKLKNEQERLKYRVNILKRAYEDEVGKDIRHMKNITQMLRLYFTIAVDKAYPGLADFPVTVTPTNNPKFGDYQCNVAPPLFAMLKGKNVGVANPRQIAEAIIREFPKSVDVIEKLEIAGPGFINVFLNVEYLIEETKTVFLHGALPAPNPCKKRVIVDMSSPNVAKEMHVGHLRSTIIGESIARLMEYSGHDVLRLNHVGDWGTQFGMLICLLQDKFKDYLKDAKQLPVSDLQTFYKEAKKLFDEDEDFKKRSYACVVQLQSLNPEYIKAWNLICDVSRKEFSKIYARLDIKNLVERGESFYQKRMESLVKELEAKGLLEDDIPEGGGALQGIRKIMHPPDKSLPLIMVKSDGGFTYDTSDMATAKNRIEEEKAEWIIYVVDAGQGTHFQSVYKCAKRAGIWDPNRVRVDHVGFGVVLGEDKKKFKTRSGDTVKLADLLDEGIKRAGDKLREKGRDKEMTAEEFEAAMTSVAYSCIKYADLSHNRNHEYVFSFDKMLEDKGNTAVYLLYAYTRIKSIARKAGVSLEQLVEYATKSKISLSNPKEHKLMKTILKFPEIIEKCGTELVLHPICELLYDIAVYFSEFYDSCYCIEKDSKTGETKIHMDRLVLCEATANVLKQGFEILAIRPLHRM
ncbi:Arginine--tRNA ligase, cytoplasmic [Orchesella cincta]|uniref:Probable arginine--tRNA ligase, cytoplasmic n=1 Tax=Orchesella cincta TaxID=48709 RepID=A0A1D2MQM8_ORCCI|nr:Arginine--tRNA ligase, cytoplasmic [Orchesella cincta]